MTNNYLWNTPGKTEQWHKAHNQHDERNPTMSNINDYDDNEFAEDDFDDDLDLSITEEEFDSLDDILCETCGEPSEFRFLLEDADFSTTLQVCGNCLRELSEEEPDRWIPVEE